MKYQERLLRLEKSVKKEGGIPRVAIRFLHGAIDWDDRIFPNEKEFSKAVDRAFRNEPHRPGPQVLIITFRREMKEYSLDNLRSKQVSG